MIDIQKEAEAFIDRIEHCSKEEIRNTLIDIVNNTLYNSKLREQFISLEKKVLKSSRLSEIPSLLSDFFLNEFSYDCFHLAVRKDSPVENQFAGIDSYSYLNENSIPSRVKIYSKKDWDKLSFIRDLIGPNIAKTLIIPVVLMEKPDFFFVVGSKNHSRLSDQLSLDLLEHLSLILNLTVKHLLDLETLKDKNHELLELNRMKDDFLMVTSHDLRSPLTGIIGLAEMMAHDSSLDPKYKRWLNGIVASGKKQLTLINEILSVARLEKGAIKLNKSDFSLKSFFEEVKENLMPSLEKKEIDLEIVLEETRLSADREKLLQVFNNLVYNGIKFSPSQGMIKIRGKKTEEWICFSVTDQGMGWEDFEEEKLFQAFTPYKRLGAGGEETTGLGLSICKNLVRLHGGRITAFSEGAGKGAVFEVFLPLK